MLRLVYFYIYLALLPSPCLSDLVNKLSAICYRRSCKTVSKGEGSMSGYSGRMEEKSVIVNSGALEVREPSRETEDEDLNI